MLTAPYDHLCNSRKYVDNKRQNENSNNTIAMIDYTNLYIKNLDSDVTSYDLCQRFKVFGKIISARVMKDTVTGISKGYGFVSFTHMEEAHEALQQMNGALFNTKNIVVTFHTHKKQQQKISKSNNNNNQQQQNHPNNHSIHLSPPLPPQPPIPNHPSQLYPIYPSQPSPPYTNHNLNYQPFLNEPYPTIKGPGSNNPWNDGLWVHHNNTKSPIPQYNPHGLKQNNTMTSVSSFSFQHQEMIDNSVQISKLREAISNQLKKEQQKDLNDLVDLIQSLKKRELSLCLFNPSFLKQKIDEAYEALYLFQLNEPVKNDPFNLNYHSVEYNSAMAILNSLEGLTLNKKKRVFGDIFYPYVRATGIKHAPKVTIRLLDTVALEELAFCMYNKQELTRKAQIAFNELYSNELNLHSTTSTTPTTTTTTTTTSASTSIKK